MLKNVIAFEILIPYVNIICANQITIQEFFEKCRPDIPPELQQELFYYYHDYFHDHKFRIPDTEVIITDSSGSTTTWSPCLDPSYRITALYNDNGENQIFDFTPYDTLQVHDRNHGIDCSGLVGTWELVWTETEGDRNEAASGVCTIRITSDDAGLLRFTYANKDFPEENIQDRELLVVPGELYPGCSNVQWIGEVTKASGDTVQYALTLLVDGTLLLQTCWEMDGIPWVSYGWYTRAG